MASSNSNLAYDLSAFQSAPKRQQKPELKVVKSTRRAASAAFAPRTLCSFAIVVTLLSLIVYNQVRLNELTGEINELGEQLTVLRSENVKLESELDSAISLRTVEEQAKHELGMNRLDVYQTEYVYLYSEDKIELTREPEPDGAAQQVKLAITSFLDRLQEYITS